MPKTHIFVLFFNVGSFHFPGNYACSCWLRNSYWRSLHPPWLFSLRLPINPFTESVAKTGEWEPLSLRAVSQGLLSHRQCTGSPCVWKVNSAVTGNSNSHVQLEKEAQAQLERINRQVLARQIHGNGRKAASLGKDWFCWARASLTAKVLGERGIKAALEMGTP